MPAPALQGVAGNSGVRSGGKSPRRLPAERWWPGEGEAGRVNASESLLRLRYFRSPERLSRRYRVNGSKRLSPLTRMWPSLTGPHEDTQTPQYRGHPPRPHLSRAERGNPDGVRHAGKPTARKAEPPSGHTMVREAKAASRKARGIHNPADRASWPGPKGR
jgi:hypothetical protein